MNRKLTLLMRVFGVLLAFGLSVSAMSSCTKDDSDSMLSLYYSDVANIGPSMAFTTNAPTFKGAEPSAFAITRITLNGEQIESQSFSVDAATGAVSITNSGALAVGEYKISVSCTAKGKHLTFNDILTIHMLPSTPVEISFDKPIVRFEYGAVLGEGEGIAKIANISASVAITGYKLQQADGMEYFKVTKDGVVSLNPNYKDVPPGLHNVIVGIETPAGVSYYDNVLKFDITSAPLELTYTPNSGKAELATAYDSEIPAFKGSLDDLAYSIENISPANNQFKIEATTGKITLSAGHTAPVGTYTIKVKVNNKYGFKSFAAAYTVEVVKAIAPISKFSYPNISVIQTMAIANSKAAGFVGDEVKFAFVELPTSLSVLTIDENTGDISAPKGNNIAKGSHTIKVRATNIKNSVDASFTLTVTENTDYFTKVDYGNNIGLGAGEAYQYLMEAGTQELSINAPKTDIKSSATVVYSIEGQQNVTSTIDEQTGAISITAKSNPVGFILVKTTTGKGTATEFSITTPVFVALKGTYPGKSGQFLDSDLNIIVTAKPFVAKINPKTGGSSSSLIFTGADANSLIIDYRRGPTYFDFGGKLIDGAPAAGSKSFLNILWNKYFGNDTKSGSKDPMSYYAKSGGKSLSDCICYVDKDSRKVVVNPDRFVDDNGVYANGVFIAQMTFMSNGDETKLNNGAQTFPIILWLSEDF